MDKLPALGPDRWALTVRWLISYRGSSSPEALARTFNPPRLSGMAIRRIIDLDDPQLGSETGDLKLARLSGMLELPPETLRELYYGNREALERLEFTREGGREVQQFILGQLSPAPDPGPPAQRRRHSA